MKTNPSARSTRRIRVMLLLLAVVALTAGELRLGESLASRFGQVATGASQIPHAPAAGLSDLVAAAR